MKGWEVFRDFAVYWAQENGNADAVASAAVLTCEQASRWPCTPAFRAFYDTCGNIAFILSLDLPKYTEFWWRRIAHVMAALTVHVDVEAHKARAKARETRFNGFSLSPNGKNPLELAESDMIFQYGAFLSRCLAKQYEKQDYPKDVVKLTPFLQAIFHCLQRLQTVSAW